MRTGETLLSSAREVGIRGPREPATAALKSLGPHYSFQPFLEYGEAGSSSAHIGRGGSIALPPPVVCVSSLMSSLSHTLLALSLLIVIVPGLFQKPHSGVTSLSLVPSHPARALSVTSLLWCLPGTCPLHFTVSQEASWCLHFRCSSSLPLPTAI